jgi:hypothetical protein
MPCGPVDGMNPKVAEAMTEQLKERVVVMANISEMKTYLQRSLYV